MYQAMNEGCDRRSRASDAARVGIAPRSGDLRKVSLGMMLSQLGLAPMGAMGKYPLGSQWELSYGRSQHP